jgi:hypothetical protein
VLLALLKPSLPLLTLALGSSPALPLPILPLLPTPAVLPLLPTPASLPLLPTPAVLPVLPLLPLAPVLAVLSPLLPW